MNFPDTDNRVILYLGLIILNLYLLVYMNAPGSIDGADTLDVAITWVQHGEPTATRLTTPRQLIVGNEEEEFYTLSSNGERYSKKGITPSLILLPLLMLTEWIPALSPRAVAMILNPIVTTLTVCQLYLFARCLNASWKISTGLAILFAFGTISVVYVKTLFGESLAGLLLLVALYQSYNFTQDATSRRVLLSGIAIALAIGVNFSYALLTIPIGLYILSTKRSLKLALLYGLPILLMGLFLGYWNILRFGNVFETGYGIGNDVEGFTTPLFYGLTGLWLSFYKGVFWFQPILLLGLFGLKRLWDKQRSLLIVSLSIILIHSTTYAMWWAWDGAWSWGSRFMLPILPIMMLLLLPALKASRHSLALRIFVYCLGLISIVLQISGILYSYIPFYETVYNGELFRWQNHIALATITNLYPRILEPAWLSEGFDGIHLLIVCLSIGSGIASIYLFNKKLRKLLVLSILSLTSIFIAIRQQAKPSYDFVRQWEHTLGNNGIAYIQSFEFDTRLLDIDGTRIIVTNPHAPQNNPLIQQQWENILSEHDTLWLITWFPPASEENWVEQSLWQYYSFVEQTTFADHRALQFNTAPPATINCEPDFIFDASILLHAYGTRFDDNDLFVTLRWQAQRDIESDYSWFVHVLDEAGNIIAQQDRQSIGGYAPTSTWQNDFIVDDFLMFNLPDNSVMDDIQLRIGYIEISTGALQRVTLDRQNSDTPYITISPNCE